MPTRFILQNTRRSLWARILQAFVYTSVEAFLALLCLIAGIPVLLDPSTFARTVSASLAPWFAYPWGSAMLLGGSMTLLGIGKENLRIERSGIAILGGIAIIYAIALVALWPVSWFTFSVYVSFSGAMFSRYWVLGQLLKLQNRVKERVFARFLNKGDDDES